ncbi:MULTISPECIES: tryptophan synthase subunit alpha [Neptunomonas]|uniref:Tryptophan synthase alpha chain n=1 Tax=Neptunomonas phycophila TaxID=1572645 RepID=A0AAW7XG21_9GAMM|nr:MULTISPECIES: tryptophan synthase subunit alpha [Neptunomonas]MBT3146142.1 tryptophan synthase subunit alpha [Neptunomonas phycophila]MDN2659699.1 tryptophan synthase subunit alpha [Neptunomonas sp. CHC150]MDO6452224.1 tryptophan synthase subunit alpha [Neptunomonas phycophila]QLE97860.1 tryptophan synthase subunit alpha [Neptunomonas phycophila]
MSRINSYFSRLKAEGKKALIPYVTAGDPNPSVTVPLLHAMVDAGADIIELGVPFSDPMADGPVIQLACERALSHNVRLLDVLDMVKAFRAENTTTPIVLMGYLNPIEVLGYERFAQLAKEAGVDGVLTVDLPPEESVEFAGVMKANALDVIYLLAPTTQEDRIESVCEYGSGYVYYVSVKGVTGSSALDVDEVKGKLDIVRRHTDMPVGVGFGIRDGKTAAAVATIADGVIVGSVLVNAIAENADNPEQISAKVTGIIADMRHAMDA